MAVKVMVAPAIARGVLKNERGPETDGKKQQRRRRSSVFDAEGNEVFITLMCLKCHKMRPLSQFGLRKMADGAIRNQPWCRSCRSGSSEKPARRRARETLEPQESLSPSARSEPSPADKIAGTRSVAAEVAAALAAGWKR